MGADTGHCLKVKILRVMVVEHAEIMKKDVLPVCRQAGKHVENNQETGTESEFQTVFEALQIQMKC